MTDNSTTLKLYRPPWYGPSQNFLVIPDPADRVGIFRMLLQRRRRETSRDSASELRHSTATLILLMNISANP